MQPLVKKTLKKEDIIGSETVKEKIKRKTPWIFGNSIRKPKINFPKFRKLRISLPMPARALGMIVILSILFVLQTGVIYLIIREPPALGSNQAGDPIFIFEDLHESFILEGIVASILIMLSSTGFILLFQASKHVYNKKMGSSFLVLGVIIILFSFLMLQGMLRIKSGLPLFGE